MNILFALLQSMRPRQWLKNGLVFTGIIFDQQLTENDSLLRVMAAFVLLSLAASTVYLVNDLVDIQKDRQHPKKKNRAIAAGRLPLGVARGAALFFPLVALAGGWLLSQKLALVLLLYLLLHVVYSFYLKNVVIIDVFAIAGGFILRVIAGVVVIEVEQFSPWLYVCAGLLSLFMAVGKRRQELVTLGEKATTTRTIFKDYNLPLLNDMLRLTLTSTAIAYTLYATEAETLLVRTEYMLMTVPFVYYALLRYLYVIYVKEHGGDPTELIFEDRPLQAAFLMWGLMIVTLLYVV